MNTHAQTLNVPRQLTVRVPEALAMLGIGRTKLYALINDREIETIKIGKATLVLVSSLEALVERRRGQAGPLQ